MRQRRRSMSKGLVMHSEVATITPAFARDVLNTRNTRNPRPIARDLVRRYALEMREGRWMLSPEAISFDTEGELLDGQHRLAAIIDANTPVVSYITRDASPDVARVLNQGRPRTAAQLASRAVVSEVAASRLSSAARLILEHGLGVPKPSNTLIVEFVHGHLPALERYAPLAKPYKAGTHAAFAFAETRGFGGVEDAARRLHDADWSDPTDPMKALWKALQNVPGQGARAQRTTFYTVLAALEYVSRGEGLSVARKYETLPARVRESMRASGESSSENRESSHAEAV